MNNQAIAALVVEYMKAQQEYFANDRTSSSDVYRIKVDTLRDVLSRIGIDVTIL